MSALPESGPLAPELAPTTRERLLAATQYLVESDGWSKATMSRIARLCGVSRQTVHTELGTRSALAQELTMRELDRFLDVVRSQILAAPDLVSAVQDACEAVLQLAEQSALVRTIVTATPTEQDGALLAMVTTDSGQIVAAAIGVVERALFDRFAPLPFTDQEFSVVVESIVRLLLSYITRPQKSAEAAAGDIAQLFEWILLGRNAGLPT